MRQQKINLNKGILVLIYLLFALLFLLATPDIDTFKTTFIFQLLIFLIVVLASLYARAPYKTNWPFYILLFLLLVNACFVIGLPIMNWLQPNDGWYIAPDGTRHKLMQTNWAYGILAGIFLAPVLIWLYSYFSLHNRKAETFLVSACILLCIYALIF